MVNNNIGRENKMKTIARNRTKLIDEIFRNATSCKVYTLDNGFRGRDCDPEHAKKELNWFDFAKLVNAGPGEYQVRVHSNCWYEIKSPVEVPVPKKKRNEVEDLKKEAEEMKTASEEARREIERSVMSAIRTSENLRKLSLEDPKDEGKRSAARRSSETVEELRRVFGDGYFPATYDA